MTEKAVVLSRRTAKNENGQHTCGGSLGGGRSADGGKLRRRKRWSVCAGSGSHRRKWNMDIRRRNSRSAAEGIPRRLHRNRRSCNSTCRTSYSTGEKRQNKVRDPGTACRGCGVFLGVRGIHLAVGAAERDNLRFHRRNIRGVRPAALRPRVSARVRYLRPRRLRPWSRCGWHSLHEPRRTGTPIL